MYIIKYLIWVESTRNLLKYNENKGNAPPLMKGTLMPLISLTFVVISLLMAIQSFHSGEARSIYKDLAINRFHKINLLWLESYRCLTMPSS